MCIAIVHNLLSHTPAGAPIPSPAKLHAFFYFLICLFAFNNWLVHILQSLSIWVCSRSLWYKQPASNHIPNLEYLLQQQPSARRMKHWGP